jgi:hypothetical protein
MVSDCSSVISEQSEMVSDYSSVIPEHSEMMAECSCALPHWHFRAFNALHARR